MSPNTQSRSRTGLTETGQRKLRQDNGTRSPAQVQQAVTADVRRAAELVATGLSSFPAFAP